MLLSLSLHYHFNISKCYQISPWLAKLDNDNEVVLECVVLLE